jgi:hypothetical protein
LSLNDRMSLKMKRNSNGLISQQSSLLKRKRKHNRKRKIFRLRKRGKKSGRTSFKNESRLNSTLQMNYIVKRNKKPKIRKQAFQPANNNRTNNWNCSNN